LWKVAMSTRHFNYTSRRRILQRDVQIVLRSTETDAYFDAFLRLHEYELPPTSRVIVEAYRQTDVRRYDFGTAANPVARDATDLSGLPDSDSLLFRVKVIEANGPSAGKLVAEADALRAVDASSAQRPSIVRVREVRLSGELWRLEFENESPILLLEERAGPRQVFVASREFKWLVLPTIFRELLREATARSIEDDDPGASETWRAKILAQARSLAGEPPANHDDSDELTGWINSAVNSFCRLNSFAQQYGYGLLSGGES
jgi:hypothetical protein